MDTTVAAGGLDIAVRDHGGDGPPVLLLHGAGGNLLAWEAIAPGLAGRALAVDLRGHGRSGDGPWEWSAVLDDLEAVVDHFGLIAPSVVGHSLGGMVAGMWARRHPECPAVVSLDGHRAAATHPENYAGLPRERVMADLAALTASFTAQQAAMAAPLPPGAVDALLAAQPAAERDLVVRDGLTTLRPNPGITAALRAAPEFADALPVFAAVTSPFLVVLATKDIPGLPPEFADLMAAHRAGARRDLGALAARRPTFVVEEVAASHGMVVECPDQVVAIVDAFLAAHVG